MVGSQKNIFKIKKDIMKNITYIVLVLGVFTFFSCRPEPLEIEIDPIEPQVVVFSQVIPGQVMTVLLTQTFDALDFSEDEGDSLDQGIVNDLLLSGAKMTVSYRDQVDSLFQFTNGLYASLQTPQHNNEVYTLDISMPDGRQLSASSIMLPFVPIMEMIPEIERTDEDTIVSINYKFEDLPEDNWYMINVYTNGKEQNSGLDLNSFFNNGGNLLKKTELLTDITLDGTTFEGRIELPNVSPTDSMVVSLSNINETYYNFLDLRKNSENFFTELTKEPISLPSNVEGGLGFFNTHYPDLRYFDLNEL